MTEMTVGSRLPKILHWNPGTGWATEDAELVARIREIVAREGIQTIVETGVNEGKSTVDFARLVKMVVGVEWDIACLACTHGRLSALGIANFVLLYGDSGDVLKEYAPKIVAANGPVLWFLDAHWDDERWPILDEIAAIPAGSGVIAIHDFGPPGDELRGHSQPNTGDRLTYPYIRDALTRWSPTHRVEYHMGDAKRPTVAIIFPK